MAVMTPVSEGTMKSQIRPRPKRDTDKQPAVKFTRVDNRPLGARNAEIMELANVSARTVTRWNRQPPKRIAKLLETEYGRKILRTWIEQAEQQDTPAAA
jgi:hypothetical protein